MKTKKMRSLPIYLGIASVWFGAHCGPGVASGNQIATYYSKFSKWGLITGVIAMIILGLCIYYSVEYARLSKKSNFKEFANSFFHPYEKFFATFFELTYVATVLMVLGSCIATGAQALFQKFGWAIWIGTLILAVITILLTVFGAELVRTSSTVMTVMILVSLLTIIIIGLASPQSQFADNWKQAQNLPPTLLKFSGSMFLPAVWSAIVYAGFQSAGNMANAVSVSEGLKSRRESVKAAVVGVFANAILIIGVALLLFAYPGVIGEFFNPARHTKSFIPNLEICAKLHSPLVEDLYLLVLLLAIITTLVSFAFAVIVRYGKYLPVKKDVKRDLIAVVIMLVLCIFVSTVGLDAIVKVGFKYLGYACIALVILPTILIGHKKVKSLSDKQKAEGTES